MSVASFSSDQRLHAYLKQIDPQRGIYIGGRFRGADQTFDVLDPADGALLSPVADGTVDDAVAAVNAADAALPQWAAVPPRLRSELLRRIFELMHEEIDDLARVISAENGKSLGDARAEVTYAAEFFRWFSEEAVRVEGMYGVSPAGGSRTVVTHRPAGVAALITPWNFPAAMATRKIAPAIAAGCTTVLRPASQTPLTAIAITHIIDRAGVPAGVVNLVPSLRARDVSDAWLDADPVRVVSFTGSTRVGRELMGKAAKRILNSSMELGGNAPFVVAADADIDLAVEGAMLAKLRGGGQACTAANRFYVHRDVVDEFTSKFAAQVSQLKVGPAADPENQIGPLISADTRKEIRGIIQRALDQGARTVVQAQAPAQGTFLAPTVLADVPLAAEILDTEIFGPVAPIATWDTDEELVRAINDTEFGLAAYVFSGDLQWAMTLAERIEAGMVGINRGLISDPAAPFGGMKQSGTGREGGHEGIHEFIETQYFSINW